MRIPALSSRSNEYHPARRAPIWTSHGQTREGGASMSRRCVRWKPECGRNSSPGRAERLSSCTRPSSRSNMRSPARRMACEKGPMSRQYERKRFQAASVGRGDPHVDRDPRTAREARLHAEVPGDLPESRHRERLEVLRRYLRPGDAQLPETADRTDHYFAPRLLAEQAEAAVGPDDVIDSKVPRSREWSSAKAGQESLGKRPQGEQTPRANGIRWRSRARTISRARRDPRRPLACQSAACGHPEGRCR